MTALICNFGFLRAYIAFGIGAVFCAIAAVLQAAFTVSANAAVDGEDMDKGLVSDYRLLLFSVCRNVCTVIAVLLAMLLPMTMVGDAYFGIDFGSWLGYGLLFGAIALVLCLLCGALLLLRLSKTGFLTLSEAASGKTRLRLRYAAIFIAVSILLFIGQFLLNAFLPEFITTGTTFDSWEDFKTFMETPDTASGYAVDGVYIVEPMLPDEPAPEASVPAGEDNLILGEDGTASYYESYPTKQITAADGTVLCEYTERNRNVSLTKFHFDESEDGLPVTVYTYDDFRHTNVVMDDLVNPLYLVMYIVNALLCSFFYIQKARKLS